MKPVLRKSSSWPRLIILPECLQRHIKHMDLNLQSLFFQEERLHVGPLISRSFGTLSSDTVYQRWAFERDTSCSASSTRLMRNEMSVHPAAVLIIFPSFSLGLEGRGYVNCWFLILLFYFMQLFYSCLCLAFWTFRNERHNITRLNHKSILI